MNFPEKAKYNNSSLHWTIFSFVMGQLMNTILLLLCSPESACWGKTYFSVLKIKIPKSYNSLHGSSMYVRLTKIAFELQRHLVMITVHWKNNYKMLFIYFFSCPCVYLSFCSFQWSRCAMTETAATVFASHIETTSKCDSYPGLH